MRYFSTRNILFALLALAIVLNLISGGQNIAAGRYLVAASNALVAAACGLMAFWARKTLK